MVAIEGELDILRDLWKIKIFSDNSTFSFCNVVNYAAETRMKIC
jgi:hypothetical protein